ncbi:MAG: protein-disulfide reductase DsbD [Colwellia sp.]|uniref:protein-disulfide reductase DsbD n=1 Tax=Colwellia sp. TaxID=56799 RepID=UPI0025C3835F|nr:protein-disulfide reductase DsbD [Colwellia sp.]NQZ27563.1 protein-disulfide reductase DsbD [Colwellia sp.]
MKKFLVHLILSGYFIFFSSFTNAIDESTLLTSKLAFPFSVTLDSPEILSLQWHIADGYYLYKKRIKLSATIIHDDSSNGDNVTTERATQLGAAQFPASLFIDDPAYKGLEVFRNTLIVKYALSGSETSFANTSLKIKYQGCADVGVCYPPVKKIIKLADLKPSVNVSNLTNLANASEAANPSTIDIDTKVGKGTKSEQDAKSEQDTIANSLASDNFILTLVSFFGFGLLLAFTPCVFPMIPILSGIIIGQGKQLSTRKAFSLSLAYVLAMALTYTVVGVLAALFGTNLQIWFQNPWVLSSFAGIFVVLSLSMFGFYDVQMPSFIQVKLNNLSNKQESGNLISAAIMGVLSALIVGPCVTAPLVGALIYIGQTGDTILGGAALFCLGLGMGAPLLVIGTSAGKILPRAGMWMEAVKGIFGVLMLAVAIWLLARILSPLITQLLWALLLIVSAVYMGALRQHNKDTTPWQLLWKGLGLSLLLVGFLMIVGASTGKSNLLSPLASLVNLGNGVNTTVSSEHKGITFKPVKSIDDLKATLKQASKNKQVTMFDFYADWCVSCKEMEEVTFKDSAVKLKLAKVHKIQADVTANDNIDTELLKKFGIIGPPAILFFNDQGEELKNHRIVGYMDADKFLKHIAKVVD